MIAHSKTSTKRARRRVASECASPQAQGVLEAIVQLTKPYRREIRSGTPAQKTMGRGLIKNKIDHLAGCYGDESAELGKLIKKLYKSLDFPDDIERHCNNFLRR